MAPMGGRNRGDAGRGRLYLYLAVSLLLFVFGGGASSPSDYSLDGQGSPGGPGGSGGYKLEGSRSANPIASGGLSLDTMPPTSLTQGPGAGTYIAFVVIGAAACFGVLTALQGSPW